MCGVKNLKIKIKLNILALRKVFESFLELLKAFLKAFGDFKSFIELLRAFKYFFSVLKKLLKIVNTISFANLTLKLGSLNIFLTVTLCKSDTCLCRIHTKCFVVIFIPFHMIFFTNRHGFMMIETKKKYNL
jgi:hypothetical protein